MSVKILNVCVPSANTFYKLVTPLYGHFRPSKWWDKDIKAKTEKATGLTFISGVGLHAHQQTYLTKVDWLTTLPAGTIVKFSSLSINQKLVSVEVPSSKNPGWARLGGIVRLDEFNQLVLEEIQ